MSTILYKFQTCFITSDTFIGGLRQPTVIEQLKRILNQYPDDGQILKVRKKNNYYDPH